VILFLEFVANLLGFQSRQDHQPPGQREDSKNRSSGKEDQKKEIWLNQERGMINTEGKI